MTKNDKFRIITSVTSKGYNVIFDGLENYFILYNNEIIHTVNDATNPQKLHKIIDGVTYRDIKENTDNKFIKVFTNELDTRFDKNNDKQLTLKNTINTLKQAYTNEDTYYQLLKEVDADIKEFIIKKSIDYRFECPLIDDEANPGDDADFNKLFEKHNNWFDLLENQLYDYVDNTENVFKGVINGLCALYGYGSRFIVINGGSEVGKSEYVKTIKKLMPNFMNLGSSTPASIRRKNKDEFDKSIVYLGDKGLKGTDDEEFKGLQEVFGGLITENEFIREIMVGDKPMMFELISDGVCVFYTEPYTNLRKFGAGDQYSSRSTFITINPVKDGLSVFLQDDEKTNPFYNIHKNYIRYLLKNPLELNISIDVKTKIYQSSRGSLRTAKYLLGLFKAYCQYMQIGNPLTTDVEDFLIPFKPKFEITEIEYLVYEKLYNNLNVLTNEDLDYKIADDGGIQYDDMLLQVKGRKNKSFFTVKQIKTYFKTDFKMNKNLKDTIDQIGDILTNLYNAGLIEKIEYQYNNQNVYYIPYNAEMGK